MSWSRLPSGIVVPGYTSRTRTGVRGGELVPTAPQISRAERRRIERAVKKELKLAQRHKRTGFVG